MTQHERKIQSDSITAFLWLKELIDRCADSYTEHKLSDIQTALDELYNDWLERVEPAEEQQ